MSAYERSYWSLFHSRDNNARSASPRQGQEQRPAASHANAAPSHGRRPPSSSSIARINRNSPSSMYHNNSKHPSPSVTRNRQPSLSSRNRVSSSSLHPVARVLPAGPCNFRDMTLSGHAGGCGCQRFWAVEQSTTAGSERPAQSSTRISSLLDSAAASAPVNAWCFCGHHACFHKHAPVDGEPHPMQDIQYGTLDGDEVRSTSSVDAGKTVTGAGQESVEARPRLPSALGISAAHAWSSRYKERSLSNDLPSTRPVSQAEVVRPTSLIRPAPLAITTQNAQAPARLVIPDPDTRAAAALTAEDVEQSATEVATPSNAGTPALRGADDALAAIHANVNDLQRDLSRFATPDARGLALDFGSTEGAQQRPALGTARLPGVEAQEQEVRRQEPRMLQHAAGSAWNTHGITRLISEIVTLRRSLSQIPNVAASIHDLSQRVNNLENFSFSHYGPIEDLNESLEHFDGRLLEIEAKVEELELLRSGCDLGSESPGPGRSFSNVPCESPKPHSREAAIERLRCIEAKLSGLEALHGPSPEQPLDLEVVLLPWGRDMKGVWVDAESDHSQSVSSETRHCRDGTGMSESIPVPVGFDEWSRFTDAWKTPRACGASPGASGRIYDRLSSRGFVRRVTLSDKTSHHVHSAISAAFGGLLALADHFPSQTGAHARALPDKSLLAFKSPFVPLRKIHKSSRLRFLLEAELTTPMLWTASFLEGSVFMKAPGAGLTRLYITTPTSYLQPDGIPGWTWQKIRELPRVPVENSSTPCNGSSEGTVVNEADALEPCWEHDARIDTAPSAAPSTSHSSGSGMVKQLGSGSFASSHPLSPQPTELEPEPADGLSTAFESSAPFSDESNDAADDEILQPAPITPITDAPVSHLSVAGRRAVSLPASDGATHLRATSQHQLLPQQQNTPTKRTAISFDTGLRGTGLGMTDTGADAVDDTMITLQKRRRVSRDGGAGQSVSSRSVDMRDFASGKKSPRDAAQHAYATPYSHGGVGPSLGLWTATATDADGDTEMSSTSESSLHSEFEETDDDEDEDDELEHALTRDEETWEGVGDGGAGRSAATDEEYEDDEDDSDFDVDEDDDDYDEYDL